MQIKKGDTVLVISGNDKGKEGKVLHVFVKKNRVAVEGVNIRSRHMRPSNANPDGGIVKKEVPIDASNVQIVDPATGKPTRIGYQVINGKKVRVAKKNGNVLDK